MDFSKLKKIYIIGIEGAATSALARILADMGIEVSGSDEGDHNYYDVLRQIGIKVVHKFSTENLPIDVDLIIHTTAVKPETNVELRAALDLDKKVLSYPEAIALIFNQSFGVAVCGSHGKTTTTAWLSFILDRAGKNPKALIGSKVPQFDNGNTLTGKSNIFIFEADEYQNKLKHYQPKGILLNNIDYDHPDFYPDENSYRQAFVDFISKLSKDGFLIANFDDQVIRSIARVNCRGKAISYAINEAADYVAYDIRVENGKQFFKVKIGVDEIDEIPLPGRGVGVGRGVGYLNSPDEQDEDSSATHDLGDFAINLPGKHNVYNALAVIAACLEFDLDLFTIRKYLEEFIGTNRRMEKMGVFRGAQIYDDYAHHPTEIKATLAGVREMYPREKIIVVFHPHTFTRTKALLDDFAKSFDKADEVIVLDIYGSAREQQGGVHAKDLISKFETRNSKFDYKYIPTLDQAEKYLRENLKRNDVVILMGAGESNKIGFSLLK